MDADMDMDYSESAYAATSNSVLSKEMRKPSGRDCKSKPRHGGHRKDKKKVQRSSMRRTPVPIARNSTAPNPIAYPRINACGTRNIRGINSSPSATN
jgi:hypothetical protein